MSQPWLEAENAVWTSTSSAEPSYVHCNVCLADFSFASGGIHDLNRLINSKKHSDFACAQQSTNDLVDPAKATKIL